MYIIMIKFSKNIKIQIIIQLKKIGFEFLENKKICIVFKS